MTATAPTPPVSAEPKQPPATPDARELLIAEMTRRMGRIPFLDHISATPVFGRNWRVNAWTQEAIGGAKVVKSFFVTTDAQGTIIACDPPLP